MADPDDDPLEEIFAEVRDRTEGLKLWLEHVVEVTGSVERCGEA